MIFYHDFHDYHDDHEHHYGDIYDLGGQEQAQAVCFSTRKVSQKVSTRPIS